MTIPARYTLTEAHFRIAELEKQNARLQEELDETGECRMLCTPEAQDEIARLQQALREIAAQRPDGTAARAVQAAREALAGPDMPACDHEWVDARNSAVESGELCIKCHALRATPKCTECGRELHGYRGPRCRYCDGTAE